MIFDLERILESKRVLRQKLELTFRQQLELTFRQQLELTFRQQLARLPVAEKLRMLDVLHEQALVLRAAGEQYKAKMMKESPPEYPVKPRKD